MNDAIDPEDHHTSSIQEKLGAMFGKMQAALDERADRLRPMLAALPMFGPCPRCAVATMPLDAEGSENESVRLNRVVAVYEVCEPCHEETRIRERLARYGVPHRVLGATLENYETAEPGQAAAVAEVRAWMADPEAVFLLMLGGCGTGKGHLAASAVRAMGSSARWTTHADLVNEYHGLPFGPQREQWRKRWLRYPVLVIDEMGGKGMTSDTPELFFGILNLRHDRKLKTILIGNIPLKAAAGKTSLLAIVGEDRTESRMIATSTMIFPRWSDYRAKGGGR